jgi:hypothetical protein
LFDFRKGLEDGRSRGKNNEEKPKHKRSDKYPNLKLEKRRNDQEENDGRRVMKKLGIRKPYATSSYLVTSAVTDRKSYSTISKYGILPYPSGRWGGGETRGGRPYV